ncbi:B12-binding domain-containing protein [Nocardiopsis sp. MG754419]|uniref:cobalamin B12-binding domain-containing protein n=1 Tax=Nocardiopsis sp. MG754419 TaxID=2259865 RepID=UPI001BA4E57E|nr:cobalamin B12-binding domain-containing protein [Nocardiopsis sp. MG754419]MBR8742987.1 cobalamin-binding protein [Nocardiopsis sp. MG754419]
MSRTEPVAGGAATVAEGYFARVAALDEPGALDLVHHALREGVDPESLLLDVIAPCQMRVGLGWQSNDWTVADEHAATHIGDRAIGVVVEHGAERTPARGRIVVACVDGEWHGLPARLLGEVLRLHGWDVEFLGTSVPTRRLTLHLQERPADLLALSCSLPTHLVNAHGMITAARRMGVPVIVGGAGFGPDDTIATRLGAELWAADARRAAALLADGVPELRPWDRTAVPAPSAEYASVVRLRGHLVRVGVEHARTTYAALGRDLRGKALDRTVEDLGHITSFLTVSLYLDDAAVFTRFLRWTRMVLDARGVPTASLLAVMGRLESELGDHPDTLTHLREGVRVLG